TPAPTPPSPAPAGAPPAATLSQPGAPASPAPPAALPNASAALPTLIEKPGDPVDVDQVVLPAKPVLILSGTSGWTDGLKNLRAAFARIGTELGKAGIAPAGRPLAVFTQTTDDEFKFDAMVPVAAAPSPVPALPADMRVGTTPAGPAYRFVHKGPYDDIDTTYETITTYLDAKDVVAKDSFIEEYLNDVADPADVTLEVNIFVQPK
ncbi:MAG: GyrI-like domain-containing protein, partial [Methylobacteriaceae bacterium]|nr:GyrI-like domain-containing protein [Methylobacteriaceae bacterium]